MILGPEWTSLALSRRPSAWLLAAGLVASPLSVVFVCMGSVRINVALDVSRVVVIACLGVAAWGLGYGPVAAVLAMSIGMGSSTLRLGLWGYGWCRASSRGY